MLEVPEGNKIYPDELCSKCGNRLEVVYAAGDENDTVFIGCPFGMGDDDHTEYNGIPRKLLRELGWDI